MKITIDTTKDSKEDIRKTIRFLETLANDNSSSESSEPVSDVTQGMFGMFGDDTKKSDDDINKSDDALEDKSEDTLNIIEY